MTNALIGDALKAAPQPYNKEGWGAVFYGLGLPMALAVHLAQLFFQVTSSNTCWLP